MKKLIISAIAAVSLLFGFASCSGDLHDDEKRPIDLSGGYYLIGSMTGWKNDVGLIPFEKTETAGSYKVPFSADSTKVNFAFLPTLGTWDGQIGGDKMVGGDMPANAKFSDTDNGNCGRNGTIDGLETGSDYKLIVTALDDGTLKIDCSSNVPPVPPTPENLPDAKKLVLFVGSFGDPVDVKWNGNVGTAVVKKGTALATWDSSGNFQCAIVEDTSWNGKFCGVTLNKPGEVKTLESGAGNMVLSEFADKTVTDKDVILTFTIIPAGTWDGSNNSFTEKTTITASYSLSE